MELESYPSRVLDAAILRQAVLNTSQSIELLREAVSNSVDADARNIDVKLVNVAGDEWNVTIQDDGNGMERRHVEAFFNAGQTEKDFPQSQAIGEKGLGSKTTFVAKQIEVLSRRFTNPNVVIRAVMSDPMDALRGGNLPTYTVEELPGDSTPELLGRGTVIKLSRVHLAKFNGKRATDPDEVADRVLHYLRTMCATGTVKNLHAGKTHIIKSIMNVGVIPLVTVEVTSESGSATRGPESGSYPIPPENVNPTGGVEIDGIEQNARDFCDVFSFAGDRTLSIGGVVHTVHYDGTAIIAGEHVRQNMLRGEMRQGLTQKSQMGLHLCKDFIPLRNENSLSRQLLHPEYYYEFKVFLNSQAFQLNADRSTVTNIESDEVAWIFQDFQSRIWPMIEAKAAPFRAMYKAEAAGIESVKKTRAAAALKEGYGQAPDIRLREGSEGLRFVKTPKKEADVSHLLAMMVQAGHWSKALAPIGKFGQYIDDSTDLIVEDEIGQALLVEVETELGNLFRHRHPMNSYDLVVVWSLGGMTNGTVKGAPWGHHGNEVPVSLLSQPTGGWYLKWGTNTKSVIVLSELL